MFNDFVAENSTVDKKPYPEFQRFPSQILYVVFHKIEKITKYADFRRTAAIGYSVLC